MSDLSTTALSDTTLVEPHILATPPADGAQHSPHLASLAAVVIGALKQAQPAIFAVTRAGPRSQAGVALGLGLAEIVLNALLQPKTATPTSVT